MARVHGTRGTVTVTRVRGAGPGARAANSSRSSTGRSRRHGHPASHHDECCGRHGWQRKARCSSKQLAFACVVVCHVCVMYSGYLSTHVCILFLSTCWGIYKMRHKCMHKQNLFFFCQSQFTIHNAQDIRYSQFTIITITTITTQSQSQHNHNHHPVTRSSKPCQNSQAMCSKGP